VSATRSLSRRAARVALAALALAAATALLAGVLGERAAARGLLGLRFDEPVREPGAALEVAATNLRLLAACLIAAAAVRLRSQLLPLLDGILAGLLALNAITIGLAAAGYGGRLLASLAAHGPPELAAFALAGGAYLTARAGELSAGGFAAVAAAALGLIAVAAVLETHVQIGGTR
jgi:hypothetical protein